MWEDLGNGTWAIGMRPFLIELMRQSIAQSVGEEPDQGAISRLAEELLEGVFGFPGPYEKPVNNLTFYTQEEESVTYQIASLQDIILREIDSDYPYSTTTIEWTQHSKWSELEALIKQAYELMTKKDGLL